MRRGAKCEMQVVLDTNKNKKRAIKTKKPQSIHYTTSLNRLLSKNYFYLVTVIHKQFIIIFVVFSVKNVVYFLFFRFERHTQKMSKIAIMMITHVILTKLNHFPAKKNNNKMGKNRKRNYTNKFGKLEN